MDAVNVCAGVLVDVATDVVKSGVRLPELKDVTVPDPTDIVQVLPSVQVCPFTVVAEFAKALFGIAIAVKLSVGVVVGAAIVSPKNEGSVPAATEVTVPPPPLLPAKQGFDEVARTGSPVEELMQAMSVGVV